LFVQGGEYGHALNVIQVSPFSGVDPWLIAPQLAIEDLMGAKPTLVRSARAVLDGDYPATHLAEVAAALGTVELAAGATRRGRKLLRRSIGVPTENALAQVEWCGQLTNELIVEKIPAGVPRAFEAMARRTAFEGDWALGVGYAISWFNDQPFSAEPMTFASYCACAEEDWRVGADLAAMGLGTHPENPLLLNNYALALIELDELPRAVDALLKARSAPEGTSGIVRVATEALLLFRAGMLEEGRQRYRAAIDEFARRRQSDHQAKAALMLAREELLSGSDELDQAWKVASELAEGSRDAGVRDLHDRIARLLGTAGPLVSEVVMRSKAERVVEPLIGNPPELVTA